ncbi:MAG: response regulator [Elusimicrobiales bacterium]|nr:response regulator [Elusimicrobiales bacterium]
MPKKILAVDDEASLRELLKRALTASDYHVTLACCAEEARALMSANIYDLLITDLILPDGAGTELIDFTSGRHGATKSIMISGAVEPWEMPLFVEKYKLEGFFAKPFSMDALLGKVREVLG